MPRDIVFIINPNSGKRKSHQIVQSLLKLDAGVDYFVSHSKEAFDKFLDANLNQYKVFVICGGDGTLNNSLKYANAKEDIILAVLPNGSGDGFANELGFKKDISNLLGHIEAGRIERVDLVKVNEGYSCNMIGLGIDSQVASQFENSGRRGLKAYVYYVIKTIFNFKPIHAKIEINGKIINGIYQMINVANTRQFGNNALIAPQAKHNDGLLDLVLIKPFPFYLIPSFIFKLFKGTLTHSKYVEFYKSNQLCVSSDSRTYHIDGESRLMPEKLEIRISNQFNIVSTR